MPFDPLTKRLTGLWNFVDQFQAGDDATRSSFDAAFGDLRTGINAMAAYLEGLLNVADLTDQRYLGRRATPPTVRANLDVLQIGDFYNTSDPVGRTNLIYIWDGAAFVPATDFAAITTFFRSLSVVDTPAAMRGILELGSAAQQNVDAFASSGAVGGIATALQLASDGLAKPLINWNDAHITGPGCGFFAGDAAAINAPVALNTVGIYAAYSASSGLLIAGTPSDGKVYYRSRTASVWGAWTASPQFDATTGLIAQTGAGAFAKRLITSTDNSLQITNPGGVAGNINISGAFKFFTPVFTLTGNTINLLVGIPAGASEICLHFRGVGIGLLLDSGDMLVQIGDAGGFETTGYLSSSSRSGTNYVSDNGFLVRLTQPGALVNGRMDLIRTGGNTWAEIHGVRSGNLSSGGGGDKTLSDVLTQIRVTSFPLHPFNAGSIVVGYR